MAIRDILIHMDDQPSSKSRLDAAIQIAKQHGAHLTGLYVKPYSSIPGYMDVQIPADLIQMQEDRLNEAAQLVESTFTQATEAEGVTSEWRCLKGMASEIISDHGRYADLIILGQQDPDHLPLGPRDDIPDQVVLSSGRPVLVIPYNFAGGSIGKQIIIGWDRGQMATRALHDALPFLQLSDRVSVMTVQPRNRSKNDHHAPGADVAHHLARHGIAVEADHITNDGMGVGDHLLSRAADLGADLLVTGAYGHSRWRELVLGGVTRQLLDSMPIPVLMSH